MATAVNVTRSAPSGARLRAGLASAWPAWRTALAAWQWVQFTGTSIANTLPDILPAIGTAKNRIESWNGITVLGTRLAMAGVGGHADWAGNEGYELDLNVTTPGAWSILSQPTPDVDVIENADLYADGRPTSTHTYYALHQDVERNQVIRLGVAAATGDGNHHSAKCHAYDLTAGDWLAAGTLPDVPESPDYTLAQCRHPVTGDIYVAGVTKLWRFNRAARTWTDLGLFPAGKNGTAAAGRASAIDTVRDQLVIFGDSYATPAGVLVFDLVAQTWSTATLTGALASMAAAQAGNAAHYHAGLDRFVMRRSWLSHSPPADPVQIGGGELLQIHPDTFAVSDLATTGGSAIPATLRGVWGLFQSMPALGGYVLVPRGEASNGDAWFVASE